MLSAALIQATCTSLLFVIFGVACNEASQLKPPLKMSFSIVF